MKFRLFHEPADMPFLIRLGFYGLVAGVCAFVARVATELMIRIGIGYEANPFSLFPPFEISGPIVAVGAGFAFSLLFLWSQIQPQYEKWAKAVAILGMLIVLIDAVWPFAGNVRGMKGLGR